MKKELRVYIFLLIIGRIAAQSGCNRCTVKETGRRGGSYGQNLNRINGEKYNPRAPNIYKRSILLEDSNTTSVGHRISKRSVYTNEDGDVCWNYVDTNGYTTSSTCIPISRGGLASGLWILLLAGGILQSFLGLSSNQGHPEIFPAPGLAPPGDPQPGQPDGGALPYTNPAAASLAPYHTVPVAVFPPFSTPRHDPARCVIFSELEYHEKIKYQQKPSYHGKRKRDTYDSYSYSVPTQYYYPTYNRKYGYVCEYIVSEDDCQIGYDCDSLGHSNGTSTDPYSRRQTGESPVISRSGTVCRTVRGTCPNTRAQGGYSRETAQSRRNANG